MTLARAMPLLLAAAAGAGTVFGFAPFAVSGVAFVDARRPVRPVAARRSPREAAMLGFAFGVGLFGAGASWLYIALENVRRHAAVARADFHRGARRVSRALARRSRLACSALAPPGSIARLADRRRRLHARRMDSRLSCFTGFPWLALGYTQVPGGLVPGYAPLGGVYLVTLVMALFAALLAHRDRSACARCATSDGGDGKRHRGARTDRRRAIAHRMDAAARASRWPCRCCRATCSRSVKFDPQVRADTFDRYLRLVEGSRGRLVVLPESAFPMFSDEVPDTVLLSLIRMASARDGDVLLGLFTAEPPEPGSDEPRYYNTVVALGDSDLQFYRKRHLVPFGETIPLKPVIGWFVRSVLAIPLADQARGGATQPALTVAGQRVAVNICYEDAFGSELIHGARDAQLLVNVTNDAWYGRSIAAEQHNQIAAMRALELGRPMLRATNTGITSAIDHTAARSHACPGSRPACSKSRSPAARVRHRICVSATCRCSRYRSCLPQPARTAGITTR